ncbi:MAG: hypothetical protein AAB066_01615 [Candidatus Margulisiibacteriota bacterium]
MRSPVFRAGTLIASLCVAMTLMSCGSNLFSFLETSGGGSSAEEAQSLLDNATTVAQFQQAANLAQGIVSSNATAEQKQEAYVVLGEALLGSANVQMTTVLGDIADVASSNNATVQDFISALPSADTNTLAAAANAINAANNLSTSTNEQISADAQLFRGVTNALVAVNLVQEVATFNNGQVDLQDTANIKADINQLVVGTGTIQGVSTYVNAADQGLSSADALSSDQGKQVDNLVSASAELTVLNNTMQSTTNNVYTLSSGATLNLTESNPSFSDNVSTALEDIFRSR